MTDRRKYSQIVNIKSPFSKMCLTVILHQKHQIEPMFQTLPTYGLNKAGCIWQWLLIYFQKGGLEYEFKNAGRACL